MGTEFLEMPGIESVPAGREPVTAEFDEVDGQITIRILTRTASKQARDRIAGSGMEDGTQEQLDRLERLLVSDDFPV